MADEEKVFVPSRPLEPGDRYGVLSGFDPGTRTLPAGFRIAPPFRPLPVDIVLEKDVAVTLRDGVTIYVDLLRPVGTEKVPVILAWSPYGKGQGTSRSVLGIFGLIGLDFTASCHSNWAVVAPTTSIAQLHTFDDPVRKALAGETVPRQDIPSAIGLNSTLFNTARIVGSALGGIIIATGGSGW